MSEVLKRIEKMIEELPPELQQEVEDFVNSLKKNRVRNAGRKLRQDWAGALRDYRSHYTSLELQKKAFKNRDRH